MPKFAANLSMMYAEHPFLERFAAAAKDGFTAVEFLFPYEHTPSVLKALLDANGLTQVLFNLPPGDWARGERGLAALPGRESEFRDAVDQALEYALTLGCKRLHAMSGCVADVQDTIRLHDVLIGNLRYAAQRLQPHGITLLIEPINTRDMPGYYLNYQAQAHAIVREVAAPNLQVQMDLYHCQIMEGDLARKLEQWLPTVGHLQIAGVPDRHEPDEGEINYGFLFDLIDKSSYSGYVGCEYRPRGATSEGLRWLRALDQA